MPAILLLIILGASTGLTVIVLTALGFDLTPTKTSTTKDLIPISIAVAVFVIALLITGLISLSVAAAISVFLIKSLIEKRKEMKRTESRVESIAIFSQSLADSISGGKSISAAINSIAKNPPKVISEEIKSLQINLSTSNRFEEAMKQFVVDVDDPAADLLAAHLIQADTHATANLASSMRNISESLNEYIINNRKISTGRRKQEFEIKGLSVVVVVMIILLSTMAPDLLDVYKRGILGELKLSLVFGCVFAGWVLVDKLTQGVNKSAFTLRKGAKL